MSETISIDEAGYTGMNLLDPVQPFFVMSSVNITKDDALSILQQSPVKEPKFIQDFLRLIRIKD